MDEVIQEEYLSVKHIAVLGVLVQYNGEYVGKAVGFPKEAVSAIREALIGVTVDTAKEMMVSLNQASVESMKDILRQTEPEKVTEEPEIEQIHIQDPIITSVVKQYAQRSNVGVEKYGSTLADNPGDFIYWLNHLQQELMDATLYIERLKAEVSDA